MFWHQRSCSNTPALFSSAFVKLSALLGNWDTEMIVSSRLFVPQGFICILQQMFSKYLVLKDPCKNSYMGAALFI